MSKTATESSSSSNPSVAVHSVPVIPATPLVSRSSGNVWCPYRQVTLLQQALTSNKTKVAFFLGAGCPVSIRVKRNEQFEALIPDIWGLTTRVKNLFQPPASNAGLFDAILQQVNNIKKREPTIEDILTHVRSLNEVIGNSDWNGLSKAGLTDIEERICDEIRNAVNVDLPDEINPYHQLASWIEREQSIRGPREPDNRGAGALPVSASRRC